MLLNPIYLANDQFLSLTPDSSLTQARKYNNGYHRLYQLCPFLVVPEPTV